MDLIETLEAVDLPSFCWREGSIIPGGTFLWHSPMWRVSEAEIDAALSVLP